MAAADGPGDAIEAVLLAGPTASGKSALAIDLARLVGGTVINTDSMQVYRDLSVITARPTPTDLEACPHLLYGHIDAAQNHSVGRWMIEAAEALSSVRSLGRLPIFVGGTGLYFRAAERGLAEVPAVPEAIRSRVRSEADGVAPAVLHERLARLDPTTAARLRPSDPQRILRAIEVFEATGRSLTAWQAEAHTPPILNPERCLRLFLAPERTALFEQIDRRFDDMIAAGALEEVEALAARNLDPALPAMRAHGVPWLMKALRGEIAMPIAITHAKADTRHYAKRQFTWFRHQMPGWRFVPPQDGLTTVRSLLSR